VVAYLIEDAASDTLPPGQLTANVQLSSKPCICAVLLPTGVVGTCYSPPLTARYLLRGPGPLQPQVEASAYDLQRRASGCSLPCRASDLAEATLSCLSATCTVSPVALVKDTMCWLQPYEPYETNVDLQNM
jgi:hypothetical protein